MSLWRTILDAYFWHKNEDDEWEHRLSREHNGEPYYNVLWSRYAGETDNAELAWSVTWTHWGIGVDVEQGWDSIWVRAFSRQVDCRRWFAGVHFGPFSLIYSSVSLRRVAAVEKLP